MTQTENILLHMKTHGSITPLEALNLSGCMRLGARIWDLRRAGVGIRKNARIAGKRERGAENLRAVHAGGG